jgi:coenzyme F420-reducing hydrogenase alpha subunit
MAGQGRDRLWEWAKEVLNRDELKEIASSEKKKTLFHHAALIDNLQILERILKLANEQLTTEELKN